MKVYMVGGAVRDGLMGLPVQDKDWVVVGATPEQMLAAGYRPVGKDFPVFLHPETQEEYALARTERKTSKGYHGFAFHADQAVTLEEDLARRDLTINAIAQDAAGQLIDPYKGQEDIRQKVLRHVTPAFAEDPVRILRVARLSARYNDFTIAPETFALMQKMVKNGEVDALVAERVWQEISKGLCEEKPSRMFDVLQACGALDVVLPEIAHLFQQSMHEEGTSLQTHIMRRLDLDLAQPHPEKKLTQRFALLTHLLPHQDSLLKLCKQLRVPNADKELAVLAHKELKNMGKAMSLSSVDAFEIMQRCDAFRQPERFMQLVSCVKADLLAQENTAKTAQPIENRWRNGLAEILKIETAPIAEKVMKAGKQGAEVGKEIETVRRQKLQEIWQRGKTAE